MGKIVLLDDLTINQIAAGEVIERPASVIKEVVENSIDAGATSVNIEIKNGGISYIHVTDNGKGIAPDDMEIAFERHATSKIRCAEDLDTVKSMGFRGEALASIAAIAKVTLQSKTEENSTGYRIVLEGGDVLEQTETGCPIGTSITIENLFFNTPVRYKFLKKDFTESGYIEDVITRIALVNPNIAIKFVNTGKTVIQTSGNGDIKSVIYSIYGKDVAENILNVEYQYEDMKVTGVIGKPVISRSNRSNQLFFVNKRYIKDKTLTSSAEQAYKGLITIGKFGFLVLNIDMSPEKVDVNVHPAKLEVRFQEEGKVFKAIYHAIRDTLLKEDLVSDKIKEKDNTRIIDTNEIAKLEQENQIEKKHSSGLFQRFAMKDKQEKIPYKPRNREEDSEVNIIQDIAQSRKQNQIETENVMSNKFETENMIQNQFEVENVAKDTEDVNIEDNINAEDSKFSDLLKQMQEMKKGVEAEKSKLGIISIGNMTFEPTETGINITKPEETQSVEKEEDKTQVEVPETLEQSKNQGEVPETLEQNQEQAKVAETLEQNQEQAKVAETLKENQEQDELLENQKNSNEQTIQQPKIVIEKIEEDPQKENKEEKTPDQQLAEALSKKGDTITYDEFDKMYSQIFGKATSQSTNRELAEKQAKYEYYNAEKVEIKVPHQNISIFNKEEEPIKAQYKFIGIAFRTYIIIEMQSELYIIDQHAAHERVLYEKVKQNYYNNDQKESQLMLIPDVITLSHKEMAIAQDNIEMFKKAGFELEEFGENTIKLTGVPNICLDLNTRELFLETLDEINTVARTAKQEIEERFIATVACKAAVKAHMALTEEEVDNLMSQLLKLPNPFTCPHGRPTAIKLTKNDLEKKFARR